jgi:hypothetical protein
VQFAHSVQLCSSIIEGKLMTTWLRSLVNAMLGKVPGKTSRPDTATRLTQISASVVDCLPSESWRS